MPLSSAEADEMRLVTTRGVSDAPLPVKYEAAKTALAECERVDECQAWKEKAKALASYARQANDDTLRKTAERIQVRAMRRCGELLKEIPDKAHGGGQNKRGGPAPAPLASQRAKAAAEAGMSGRQVKDVMRVGRIPSEEFEQLVESDDPPSVAEFVEIGTRKKVEPLVDLQGRDPEDFNRSLYLGSEINRLAESIEKMTPKQFVRGCLPRHFAPLRKSTKALVAWLSKLASELEDA
jgi:hypothetical protein